LILIYQLKKFATKFKLSPQQHACIAQQIIKIDVTRFRPSPRCPTLTLKNVKTINNEYEISCICICYEIKDGNHNESMEIETMDIVKLMPKMITQIFQNTQLEIYIYI
jgi:hypothetical protein